MGRSSYVVNGFESYALKDLLKEIFSRLGSIEPLTDTTYKLTGKSGTCGIFSIKENRIVLPIEFDRISILKGNHLFVQKGKKIGLFSAQTLSIVLPVDFDRIAYAGENHYEVTKGEKVGTFHIGTNTFTWK